MNPKPHITIDRLALYGFATDQREAVAAGFRAELARLLATDGARAAFGESRSVNALNVAPRPDGNAGAGEAAARQFFRGLRR